MDADKDHLNRGKHGLNFAEAALTFHGPIPSRVDERYDYGNERSVSIGAIGAIVVVVVVHTRRGDHMRIISARLANRREKDSYHEYLRQAPR